MTTESPAIHAREASRTPDKHGDAGGSGFVPSRYISLLCLRLYRISDRQVMRQVSELFKDHPTTSPQITAQDIVTQQAALQNLSHTVTAVTTISDLPNEILSYIFDIGSLFDESTDHQTPRVRKGFIRGVSQVCWRWYQRTCAPGNPHFWVTGLSLLLEEGSDPMDTQLARFMHGLAQSADSDLTVAIIDSRTGNPAIATVRELETRLALYGLSVLLPHARHLWKLNIGMDQPEVADVVSSFINSLVSTPRLVFLRTRVWGDGVQPSPADEIVHTLSTSHLLEFPYNPFPFRFGGHFNLANLQITFTGGILPQLPRNLKYLDIHPGVGYGTDLSSVSIDWDSFIGALSHLTYLRVLIVTSIISDPPPGYETPALAAKALRKLLPSLKECNIHGSVRFHRAFTLLIECESLQDLHMRVPMNWRYVAEAEAQWPQIVVPNLSRLQVSFHLIMGSQLVHLLGHFGQLSCPLQVEETGDGSGIVPVATGKSKPVKLPPNVRLMGISSLQRMVHILSVFDFEETTSLTLESSGRMGEVYLDIFMNTWPIPMPRLHALDIELEAATPRVLMNLDRLIEAPRLRSLSAPDPPSLPGVVLVEPKLEEPDHLPFIDSKGLLSSITRLDLSPEYVEDIIPLATNVRQFKVLWIELDKDINVLQSLIWPDPGGPESEWLPMMPHLDKLTLGIFGDGSDDGSTPADIVIRDGVFSLAQEVADSRKRVGKPLTRLILNVGHDLPIAELGSDGIMRTGM